VGFRYNTVDYLLNPSRGLWLESDVAVGTKQVARPPGLDSLDYGRLLRIQPRQEYRLEVRWYIPHKRITWLLGGRIYYLALKEYFRNDLPFMGGSQSLRGFNENQFQASAWAIGTAELRLRMSKESYIGLLLEGGRMEQRVGDNLLRWHPVATGFMLSIPTAAGQLMLSYAIGMTEDIPFRPERGRVHLGLEARF
jgi:translocation and assembly module TamA